MAYYSDSDSDKGQRQRIGHSDKRTAPTTTTTDSTAHTDSPYKNAKNPTRGRAVQHPPIKLNISFGIGRAILRAWGVQIVLLSEKKYYLCDMKIIKGNNGLTVKDGRLINNRPDGVTMLQQAIDLKNAAKREKKISMMEEAYLRADIKAKMLGLDD